MIAGYTALCDRLFADLNAAGVRPSNTFYMVNKLITWSAADKYLRLRAAVYKDDVFPTSAQMERAIEHTKNQWQRIAPLNRPLRIVTFISLVAKSILQHTGWEMVLVTNRNAPGREILQWRFISLLIPPAILIAAATRDEFPVPKAVRILNPSMGPDFSVAQNHLHHAAITSFEELWVSLRRRTLLEPGSFVTGLRSEKAFCPQLHKGSCPGGKSDAEKKRGKKDKIARIRHMAQWADLIRQTFIARRVLEAHAWHDGALTKCTDSICQEGKAQLRAFLAGRIKSYSLIGTAYPWTDELVGLGRRYRKYTTPERRRKSELHSNFIRQEAASERRLLARAFARLRPQAKGSPDDQYEILFLQYLRVKTAIFKLLVHPPGEHGLEKFLEYFSQIKVYAGETDGIAPPKPDEPGLTVQATEYRVAPDAWLTKLCLKSTVEAETKDSPKTESAWLIHFKRSEADDSLPLFGTAVREMESDAGKIAAALDQDPRRLRKLRGIDLCGVEGAQPLWVAAPTLRALRRRSQQTAARRTGLRLEPLHLTVHAGEDFRWLTSGVRAVAEPFQWHLIERGDRIGHGIAITLEPERWWEGHAGEVMEPTRIDRFLDLAFLATYTDSKEYRRSPEQSEWLKIELKSSADKIWPKFSADCADIIEIAKKIWDQLGRRITRLLMHDSRWVGNSALKANGSKSQEQADDYKKWLHSYLWSRSVQEKAHEPIRLKVDDDNNAARTNSKRNELEMLVEARKCLIREMARWQVCIESCPSSNLVVGSLDAMSAQDFLQKRPTKEQKLGKETLTWTISTDDPITFSTSLADEYAYAWAGMVLREKKPYDPSYARALLDEAAQTSMRMRFTLPDRQKGSPTRHRKGHEDRN
jgi:hypothetical protein